VSVVPCFEAGEPVLNGVGRDSTGVGGCVSAEYELVGGKTEVGWYSLSFAEVEEVVDVA
jgi:hypothetical protein